MTTLNKGTDLLLQLDFGDITYDNIISLKLFYYTPNSEKIECNMNNGKIILFDNKICAKLETEDTLTFNGVLKCDIELNFINESFTDGGQLISKTMYCDVNFK